MSKTPDIGDRVRDRVTGIEGTVTGYARWITGCDSVLVQPNPKEDGDSLPTTHWFDINRVEVTKEKRITLKTGDTPEENGGPSEAPVNRRR